MNTWFKVILTAVLTCSWLGLTPSPALAINAQTVAKVGEELKVAFSSTETIAGRNFLAQLINSDGKVVRTIVSEASPKATLQRYTPSELARGLRAQQDILRNMPLSENFFLQKLMTFPTE